MHIGRSSNIVFGYSRPNNKWFSFGGSLLFLLFMLIADIAPQASAKSQDEDLPHHFDASNNFRDVDDSEKHRVNSVNGAPQGDHPIIVYKEDFVIEDYVLPKNETKSEKHKRRHKNITHRRNHTKQNFTDVVIEENTEKILFDVIPEKPVIVPEDMEKHRNSQMKLVPLIEDLNEFNELENGVTSFKKELQKRPKKFHHRVRRHANGEHAVHKRNPYFRHIPKNLEEVQAQFNYFYVKHSVAGKKHNGLDIPFPGARPIPTSSPVDNMPISFENRVAADESDRVIFSGGRTTPRSTTESIFRDPRPENFDFSFMNPKSPATTAMRAPTFSRRPVVPEQEESIFRDPRPENFDFGFMNPQGQQGSVASAQPPIPAPTQAPKTKTQSSTQGPISQCVWAIVNCCTPRSSEIRYACFEQNGCYGAFWDLNPCGDNVRDIFINFVAKYYD